jgi:serine/threonine-protein kinase RsbW
VPKDISEKLTLAVDEACTNAIKHGHGCNPKENILIALEKKKEHILFKVYDIGVIPENLCAHVDKPLSALVKERKKGGLGLKLMHRIMDDVRFITKNGVSYCIMVKNI